MMISTDDLRAAVRITAPAVTLNPDNPALAGARLSTSGGALTIRTTDYETWIETRVDIEQPDLEEWSAIVSHRLLSAICGAARAGRIDLTPGGSGMTLTATAGRAVWELPTMGDRDPVAWPDPGPVAVAMPADVFAEAVGRVATAAADRAGYTPPLHVVHMAVRGNALTLAASDRKRLNVVTVPVTSHGAVDVIDAYPTADRVLSTAAALSGEVTMNIGPDGRTTTFADERTSVTSRAIDVASWLTVGENVEKWVGMVGGESVMLATDLADAVRAAAVTLADGDGVRIAIDADTCAVGGTDTDSGARSVVTIEAYVHTGRGLVVHLDPTALLATLGLFGVGACRIAWTGAKSAAMITAADGTDDVFVIMPMVRADSGWTS